MSDQLDTRYEIRQLTSEHADWAKAIVCHSNMFHSTIFTLVYPEEKTQRLYKAFHSVDYLCMHQISSGLSYGLFDKEYTFKRPESAATGGKLYWDENNLEADPEKLLEQMDFPLVSVALAYDSNNPLDLSKVAPAVETLPVFGTITHELALRDPRDPATWAATGPNQVLLRNATSTRREYEGKGLMKKLAQSLMRTAADKGFRGIQIDCFNDAVTKIWSNPPAPFKGKIVCSFDVRTYEQTNEEGEKSNPFYPSKQVTTKVYVTLR